MNLASVFGKAWWKSATAWGLWILAVGEAAAQSGLLGEDAASAVRTAGGIVTVLGLRRAQAAG